MRLDNPYAYQRHLHDKTQPENLGFLKRLRALLERYPGTTTVGEVGCDRSLQTMAEYTSGGDKLHMAYSFDLLTDQCSADFLRGTVNTIEAALGDGWPCWSIGNHDVARVMSRWGDERLLVLFNLGAEPARPPCVSKTMCRSMKAPPRRWAWTPIAATCSTRKAVPARGCSKRRASSPQQRPAPPPKSRAGARHGFCYVYRRRNQPNARRPCLS